MLPYSSNTTGPVSSATLVVSMADQWRAQQDAWIASKDTNEVLDLVGRVEGTHRVLPPEGPRPTLPRRFRFLSDSEIEHLPPPSWQVEPIVPNNSLVVLWGQPGVGKTFLALDLACCIASGQSWHGAAVKQGSVLYAAAEAQAGIGPRLVAWKDAHDVTDSIPIWFATEAPRLADEDDVGAFLSALGTELPEVPAFIVLDTLARCFAGYEENNAKDMGLLVDAVDRIRWETGATVVLVHHSTKKGDTERGSGSLGGAADAMIKIDTSESGVLTLRNLKQKDFAKAESRKLRLVPHLESCILRGIDEEGPSMTLTHRHRDCLRALERLGAARATAWEEASGIPSSTFNRYRLHLLNGGLVGRRGTTYEVTEAGVVWLDKATHWGPTALVS